MMPTEPNAIHFYSYENIQGICEEVYVPPNDFKY